MLLRPQPTQPLDPSPLHHSRKRKAESQPDSNERLSKRLSLLNLEQNGHKLYVPVESSQRTSVFPSTSSATEQPPSSPSLGDEAMRLDDTKHKVYIYSLDDELSSDSEPEADDRGVLFLPDIEKHLRANRIPPHVLQRQIPPDVADMAAKQLVLYRVPTSLSVPEEQDSVRKAIIEARQRLRERQEAERERRGGGAVQGPGVAGGTLPEVPMEDEVGQEGQEDADAMELD